MISVTTVYELIDMRQPKLGHKVLAPIVMLQRAPNELHVAAANGIGYVLPLATDEDDERLEFDEKLDQIVFHTDDGDMVLTPLRLDRYNNSVRPFVKGPTFVTQAEMEAHWSQVIEQA